jgi:hypothetical protein
MKGSNYESNDADRMMQMITGYWVTQVVHGAATFSIADHLAKAPATAEDIADAEGTDPSATFRLLRTCASLDMVKYDGNSRFAGTSLLDTCAKTIPKACGRLQCHGLCLGIGCHGGGSLRLSKREKARRFQRLARGCLNILQQTPLRNDTLWPVKWCRRP